jgi:hypothetical protein
MFASVPFGEMFNQIVPREWFKESLEERPKRYLLALLSETGSETLLV